MSFFGWRFVACQFAPWCWWHVNQTSDAYDNGEGCVYVWRDKVIHVGPLQIWWQK